MTKHQLHYEFESVLKLLSEQVFDGIRDLMDSLLHGEMNL